MEVTLKVERFLFLVFFLSLATLGHNIRCTTEAFCHVECFKKTIIHNSNKHQPDGQHGNDDNSAELLSCNDLTIDGSNAVDLTVDCLENGSCKNLKIKGPKNSLKVICVDDHACNNVYIRGKHTKNIELQCLNGEESCNKIKLKQRKGERLNILSISKSEQSSNLLNSRIYGPKHGTINITAIGSKAIYRTKFELRDAKKIDILCSDAADSCNLLRFGFKYVENVNIKCLTKHSCINSIFDAKQSKHFNIDIGDGFSNYAMMNSSIYCPSFDISSCSINLEGYQPIIENINIYAKNGFNDVSMQCIDKNGQCEIGKNIKLLYCTEKYTKSCNIIQNEQKQDLYECDVAQNFDNC